MAIDGTTAPGFSATPVVSVNFNSNPGLTVAAGADCSNIKWLSLVRAQNAAITLQASNISVQRNYVGVSTTGAAAGNLGDGVKILSPSGDNLIGNLIPSRGDHLL